MRVTEDIVTSICIWLRGYKLPHFENRDGFVFILSLQSGFTNATRRVFTTATLNGLELVSVT